MNDFLREARRTPPRRRAERARVQELATLDPEALRAAVEMAGEDVAQIQMPTNSAQPKDSPDILTPRMVNQAIAAHHRANQIGGSQ